MLNNIDSDEHSYLQLLDHVLTDGEERMDRTGVGTKSLFGTQLRFDLRKGFPLLTTKKVNFDAVKKELLWFIRGETNTNTLGCGIWDAWADDDGELGPIYGAQWRGRTRNGLSADQICDAIELLRTDPTSRRNIVSAWNVDDLPYMALPPCHVMFQFYVSGVWLDIQVYQRSADLALGLPFNIASYALLLTMMAQETGKQPRFLVHTIGDAHIYLNHIDGVKLQLLREPFAAPTLKIAAKPFFDVMVNDITVERYEHHPAIKFKVAV